MLAVQLTAALDGPLLLYLSATDLTEDPARVTSRITRAWHDLIHRVARARLAPVHGATSSTALPAPDSRPCLT